MTAAVPWSETSLHSSCARDAGGKPSKFRYTEVHLSRDLYTYQAEASVGGGPWTTIAQGKIAKVK